MSWSTLDIYSWLIFALPLLHAFVHFLLLFYLGILVLVWLSGVIILAFVKPGVFRGGASLYLPVYVRLPACLSARPKFLVVRAKLYSPNLGKYIIGVNVVVWFVCLFVCLCHGLVWTLTSSNTISDGRTDGSNPPTSAT